MKQQGLVMVFSLLVLVSLTLLGVASVSSSLMQNKMAISLEEQSLAFDAAEAAIAGVLFESEDRALLVSADLDPLSDARQNPLVVSDLQPLTCLDAGLAWTDRTLVKNGLTKGTRHTAAGKFITDPNVESWSRTSYVTQQACLGSSNVLGGSNISCQIFMIKGCGQIDGSPVVVANTLNASIFAPSNN